MLSSSIILKMSETQKSFSGVKIMQQPGGASSVSLNWGHKEETTTKTFTRDQPERPVVAEQKNP